MAHLDKISTRYARAIYEFLKTEAKARPVIDALKTLGATIEENENLEKALTTELFTEEQRKGVIEDLVTTLKANDDTRRILLVLSEQGRLTHVNQIAERLNQLLLEAAGAMPLSVTAALDLEDADKKKIEEKFKKILGKNVEATYHLNPELYGGLKVTAGGRTFDGSLSGWLASLEEKLIGGSL